MTRFIPDKSLYTKRKQSLFWQKNIIAKTILLVLFCTKFAVGAKEKPVIKIWTNPSEYSIKAEILVPRSYKKIYRILMNYESIDEHIELIKDSRVLKRKENTVHLLQIFGIDLPFFALEAESYLVIEEVPDKKISFREEKGEFKVHQGSWTLIPEKGGRSTLMRYELQAIPDFYAPKMMVNYFMKKAVQKGIEELYQWIIDETKPL